MCCSIFCAIVCITGMCNISLALPPGELSASASSLLFSLRVVFTLCSTTQHTQLPKEKNNNKGNEKKDSFPRFAQSMLKANSRKRVAANCLSIVHTSISPSNSEESSRVTLKGTVLSRLEPFWGDLRFLFGDVFSDISSVSLCSSRCLEFCSCKKYKTKNNQNRQL